MSSQSYQTETRLDPIAERVGAGMFTDREREMASLIKWVDLVAQKVGRSRALVSHRRHGKTAILERLYNQIFWERSDVMPFYFELAEQPLWINDLVREFLQSFLQQYLAYRSRNPEIAFRKISLAEVQKIAEEQKEQLVLDAIQLWEEIEDSPYESARTEILHKIPHDFAIRSGLSIIYMFDEFQRLDQQLYFDREKTHKYHKFTSAFATAAESSRAPMLIAGSQVTVLLEQALWGAMVGRVGTSHIGRLPHAGGVELVFKFAQQQNLDISLDVAYIISRLVDGHPYYIWCLFNSEYLETDLTTEEGVQDVLTFEVENRQGHIYKFWHFHFYQHMEAFSLPHARRMIFYLTQYADREVRVENIQEDLNLSISIDEINDTLRRLRWCDLIRERGNEFYGGLSDPLLAQVLSVEYSWEIKQLERQDAIEKVQEEWKQKVTDYYEEIISKMRSELNYWVGHAAEAFIRTLMRKHFKNQTVDGTKYFNQPSEIQLTSFKRVYPTKVQTYGAVRSYQIDAYGIPERPQDIPWSVEVKNWRKPVGTPEVEHFWNATQNLAEDKEHEQIICWFHARSGFTGPAQEFMEKKGILNTDERSLSQMLRDFQVIEQWQEE